MKNLRISVIALFLGAAFAVTSCGPSFCDCVTEAEKDEPDKDMLKKCKEKYDPSEDASEEELEELMKKMEECKK